MACDFALPSEDPCVAHAERLQLLERAHALGVFLRPIWKPLHQLPMYKHCPSGSVVVAENQALRLLNLPSSPQLSETWLR